MGNRFRYERTLGESFDGLGFDVSNIWKRAGFLSNEYAVFHVYFRGDPHSNVKVQFTSKDEAIAHCEKNGWKYFVQEKPTKPMRPKSYGVNFAWNKKTRVSTK